MQRKKIRALEDVTEERFGIRAPFPKVRVTDCWIMWKEHNRMAELYRHEYETDEAAESWRKETLRLMTARKTTAP